MGETPEQASRRMAQQAVRDTKPELRLRKLLFAHGLRYRVDYRLPLAARTKADIAFPRLRVAIFVDGCFWHACPQHGTRPNRNAAWWAAKLDRTRERDQHVADALLSNGWAVLRVWEHEDPETAAQRVIELVELRRLSS